MRSQTGAPETSQLDRLNQQIQGLVTGGNRNGAAYAIVDLLAGLLDRLPTTQGRAKVMGDRPNPDTLAAGRWSVPVMSKTTAGLT